MAHPNPVPPLAEPPATPHLAWLSKRAPRDKVLPEGVVRALLARPVLLEEQPDGVLIGIDFPDGESARVHRRGHLIGPGAHPQFHSLWGWLAEREAALARALGDKRVLFGQWCFATRAVRHDALPDWLIVSDVFDHESGRFWSAERRNALARQLGLATAPEVAHAKVDLKALVQRLGETASALGAGGPAGFVVRLEQGDHLVERAQLVRAEVADEPDDPSTKKTLGRNALAAG
jgi:hypothetical protein